MKTAKTLAPLREFRKAEKLTHQAIADKMKIKRGKYTKTELGYQEADLDFIRAFQQAFNLSSKDIQRIFIDQKRSDTETTSSQAS